MLHRYGSVLTEHVGSDEVIQSKDRELTDKEIHDRDLGWIVESEVTVPSLGVGYEIGRALEMDKPILCLFDAGSGRSLSAMVAGSEQLVTKEYKATTDVEAILEEFFTLHAARRTS